MRSVRTPAAVLLPFLSILIGPGGLRAQDDVLQALQSLAEDNAELYVNPVTTGLGIGLNSGFNQTAAVHSILGFDIGVRVVGALVPDEAETFRAVPPPSITLTSPFSGQERTFTDPYSPRGGSLQTPTAVGDGPGVVLEPTGEFRDSLEFWLQNPDNFNLAFPGGFDIPAVPFAVIQGSVGLPLGFEVSVRFIPSIEVADEVGDIQAFGFGVKHSISQWFPAPLPVDLAVSVGWQDFEAGDYLDASGFSYGALASRSLGPLTLYANGFLSDSEVDVDFRVENPDDNPGLPPDGTRIAFTTDLDTEARLALGLRFELAIFELTGEYAFGEFDTVSGRVGITLR